MECAVIVTYRCNARCLMCGIWRHAVDRNQEFPARLLHRLPTGLSFVNVTGGEPFLRDDLGDLLDILLQKAKRLVISSNGVLTDRIVETAGRFGNRIGFRISLEGLAPVNNRLRGLTDGFERGIRTVSMLRSMKIRDLGLAMTVSDQNAQDLLPLYRLTERLGVEFATAVVHNSFYFHTEKNVIRDSGDVSRAFEDLSLALLRTRQPKNWFRAYFNMGLAGRVRGRARPLPCNMGTAGFFLDPSGRVLACNGSKEPLVMGDLNEADFQTIWAGDRAEDVRRRVRDCTRNCWMIGSAAPAIRRHLGVVGPWVVRNKIRSLKKGIQPDRLDVLGPRPG